MPRRPDVAPVRVLVTRALDRSAALVEGCRAIGLEPVLFPCLAIEGIDSPVPLHAPTTGLAIFTSRNAVEHASRSSPLPWPGVKVFAIGPATATALESAGQGLAAAPVPPFTSESLIESSKGPMTCSASLPVVIVKGEGGRTTLETALHASGRQVSVREVYRRVTTRLTRDEICAALDPLPDIVCTSSDEVLANLLRLAEERADDLKSCPLVVNSERGAKVARALGFRDAIMVADAPGDDGQLRCLEEIVRARQALTDG